MTTVATLPLTVPDLLGEQDLDPLGRETTSDLQTLEQDVLHLLGETLGSNIDDINRGVGVNALLSGNSLALTNIASVCDGQLKQDDRITDAKTTITQTADNAFEMDVTVVVGAATLGLAFSFSSVGGLSIR